MVEDCNLRFFQFGGEINITPGDVQDIRRCRITDNYNLNDKVSSGIGTGGGTKGGGTTNVEQNFFDINGYNPISNPGGSSLNHNVYFNANNTLIPGDINTAIYVCNLLGNMHEVNGSTFNAISQQRCGGHNNNNLWLIYGSGAQNWGDTNPGIVNKIENEVAFGGQRDNCVYQLTGTIGPDGHGGYYGLKVTGMPQTVITNCIAIGTLPNPGHGAQFALDGADAGAGVLYVINNTISYRYSHSSVNATVDTRFGGVGSYTLTGYNIVTDTAQGNWPHPDRTPGKYLDEIIFPARPAIRHKTISISAASSTRATGTRC